MGVDIIASPLALLSEGIHPYFMGNHSSHCLSPLFSFVSPPPAGIIENVNYIIIKYVLLLNCDFWLKVFPLVYFWH